MAETPRRDERQDGGTPQQPAPDTSPFSRPGVMTGYPLSADEKAHVEQVIEQSRQ